MDEEVKYAERPDSLKQLRACKTCKLIKTRMQVCTYMLPLESRILMLNVPKACSSSSTFVKIAHIRGLTVTVMALEEIGLIRLRPTISKGMHPRHPPSLLQQLICIRSMISMLHPEASWVAKWQRMRYQVCL